MCIFPDSIAQLVGVRIHIHPVHDGRNIGDGRHEAFVGGVGVGKIVSCVLVTAIERPAVDEYLFDLS